jgi:DNA-binding transcriptional ArsR family regulator
VDSTTLPLNTTAKESRIEEYLRRTTTRKIVLFLLEHDQSTSATYKSTTVSWHLSWLRKAGIVSVRGGLPQTYRIRDKDLVAILMNKSQKSGMPF